jgi:hypothetical protein
MRTTRRARAVPAPGSFVVLILSLSARLAAASRNAVASDVDAFLDDRRAFAIGRALQAKGSSPPATT